MFHELISIVTLAYNVAGYLPKTIESVLEQTYPHWELIVVDDGSEDDTGAIADRYAARDVRIRVVHQANAGVMSARKRGVEEARGEYLLWVDGDDYLTPDALELLYRFIREKDLDIAIGNVYRHSPVYTVKCQDKEEGLCCGDDYIKALLTNRILGGTWARLYRRWLWEDLDYPSHLNVSEDKYLNLQIARRGVRTGRLHRWVFYYVKRSGSLSHGSVSWEYRRELAQKIGELFCDRPELQPWLTMLDAQTYLFYVSSSRSPDISRDPWVIELHRKLREPQAARLLRETFNFSERANIRLKRSPITAPAATALNTVMRIGTSIRKRLAF